VRVTGGWGQTPCDWAIVDDATLGGMVTHCATAPASRAVAVEGSTLGTTITVAGARRRLHQVGRSTVDLADGAWMVELAPLADPGDVPFESLHLADHDLRPRQAGAQLVGAPAPGQRQGLRRRRPLADSAAWASAAPSIRGGATAPGSCVVGLVRRWVLGRRAAGKTASVST